MKLAKWGKQRCEFRNTWTKRGFCAGEWGNEYSKNFHPQLCNTAWGKKFAHGVFICFLKEFAFAVGRSGASCEA